MKSSAEFREFGGLQLMIRIGDAVRLSLLTIRDRAAENETPTTATGMTLRLVVQFLYLQTDVGTVRAGGF